MPTMRASVMIPEVTRKRLGRLGIKTRRSISFMACVLIELGIESISSDKDELQEAIAKTKGFAREKYIGYQVSAATWDYLHTLKERLNCPMNEIVFCFIDRGLKVFGAKGKGYDHSEKT